MKILYNFILLILGIIAYNAAIENQFVDISPGLDSFGASKFKLSDSQFSVNHENIVKAMEPFLYLPIIKKKAVISEAKNVVTEAKSYAPYAGAAYCKKQILENSTCLNCHKLSGSQLNYEIFNVEYNLKAFIFSNKESKEIILTIRGSDGMAQALDLINIEAIDKTDPENIQIFSEFQIRLNYIIDPIIQYLSVLFDKYKNYKLIITGHSLGGAISVLAAPKLKEYFNLSNKNIAVYTYGQPRVGNFPFAVWYRSLGIHTIRTVTKNDVVPLIIPYPNFQHIGQEIYVSEKIQICDEENSEDPSCSLDNQNIFNIFGLFKKALQKPQGSFKIKLFDKFIIAHKTAFDTRIGNDAC